MSELQSLLAMFEAPDVLHVRKRPLPVSVEIAEAAGVCETLEGPVSYQAGDALVSGVRKERWPVRRDVFISTYEPMPPTQRWKTGTYVKVSGSARAVRLNRRMLVSVGWQSDPLVGNVGDWLLHYADGGFGVVADDIFSESYEPEPGDRPTTE